MNMIQHGSNVAPVFIKWHSVLLLPNNKTFYHIRISWIFFLYEYIIWLVHCVFTQQLDGKLGNYKRQHGKILGRIRLIYMKPRRTHTSPLMSDLHWLSITQRIQFKTLFLTYKALHNESPQYLSDLLHIRSQRYNIRASLRTTLQIPRTNKALVTVHLLLQHQDYGIHCLITFLLLSPLEYSKDCWNVTCSINCIILCMFTWLFFVACLYLFFLFALCIREKRGFTNACLLLHKPSNC